MADGQGSQYAIQIAVHTLRDRCKNLQQRVALLEEENVNLRVRCTQNDEAKDSLNELDCLRVQVTELSEQKEQLQNKVKMVTNENQDLWGKLSKLTRVNKTLGSQLSKINDTLTQHSSAEAPTSPTNQSNLIRSKTFTKSEVQTKLLQKNLEENDKISLELEDISLKLSDCFSKQRKELDDLCSEISEMTFANYELTTDNCGFLFDEELQDDTFVDIHAFQEDLAALKDVLLYQQTVLELNVKNMLKIKDKFECEKCQSKATTIEKCTSTSDLSKKTFDSKSTETEKGGPSESFIEPPEANDRICPLCSKEFREEIDFVIYRRHVEDHFVADVETYELL